MLCDTQTLRRVLQIESSDQKTHLITFCICANSGPEGASRVRVLTLVHLGTRARGSLQVGPALGLVVVVYSNSTHSPAAVADVSIAAVTELLEEIIF